VWVYVGMSCGSASSLAEALTNKRPARVPATTSTVLPVRPFLGLPGEPPISPKTQKKKNADHAHREASALAGELPEESDQFRFLRASCFANLKKVRSV
jgi:hypothetical protein